MNSTEMSREKKAQMFDQLLTEHDKLSREVSVLQSKFDLTREDQKKIESLKKKLRITQIILKT
jgi:GTP-binding protein EngB required for normal cell division